PDVILEWAALPPVFSSWRFQAAAPLFSAFTLGACIWYEGFEGNGWVALTAIAAQAVFGLVYRNRVRSVIGAVDQPGKDLDVLSLVLERLEREKFSAPKLQDVYRNLKTHDRLASKEIGRLKRFVEL